MRFVVATYGPRQAGMLLTHLRSIERTHPKACASVYWQDLPPPLIDALRAGFSRFDFVETDFALAADPLLRISSKVRSWSRAAEEHAAEARLCFADVDTLVRRDLHSFFVSDDADVVFTFKPQKTALNSGVMLARGGPASVAFFRAWRERTLEVLGTPELFRQANDYSLEFGGGDQLALWRLLDYRRAQLSYTLTIEASSVRLRAEPCALLNETNSVPLNDEQHLLHYKGGWQPILLEGRPFTRNRPRQDSWPMYLLYLRSFAEALECLNARLSGQFTPRDFGVACPGFADLTTGAFRPWRHTLARGSALLDKLGSASRRAGQILREGAAARS